MPIDPGAIGATTKPHLVEWTDRETMLYALGVGAGLDDLAFTTENSHGIPQQVLPTYAVIACPAFGAIGKIGTFNFGMLLHGSQQIKLFKPLPAAGKLSVVSDVADLQDKGEGKNAVVVLRGRGSDPETGELLAETVTTLVIRAEGGFGGQPGQRPVAPQIPDREPDARVALPTREDQALIYRLSGDRNPLHSDPWFAQKMAGFSKADPARAVHIRGRRPGAGGRTRRGRRVEDHFGRCAVHRGGVPRRHAHDVDLADRTRARGVPHRGVEPGWIRRPAGARGRRCRIRRLTG